MSALQEFLKNIDTSMIKYYELLKGQGYENEQDIFMLNEKDLDSVHIMDTSDRNAILNAVAKIGIVLWLRHHKLEDYEHHFRRLKINTLSDLKKCVMCDDCMDELEVMIPGHRKRLAMAASHICLAVSQESWQISATSAVVHGIWEKNMAIPTQTDFLWVNKVSIKSNILGHEPVELLNCMVDTGSEVVTIKNEILPELDLKFLQHIKSKGIHKEEEKPLYRGTLKLGNREIEVDVMPDSYNSVGCNVFQQFSHIIDGRYHLWFDPKS